MSRRRRRTTGRKPRAERQLRMRGVRRGTPDAKRLSRAFIALALAKAEADAQAHAATVGQHSSKATKGRPSDGSDDEPNGQGAGDAAP